MLLKRLFTSQTRVKLLQLFLINPDEEYFIRELTRRLDEQINSVRRELDNLKQLGLLKSRAKNRRKFYVVNKKFPLFNELRSMVIKTTDQNKEVIDAISKMGQVEFLLLSGYFIGKESDVDLVVVGELERKALEDYLEKQVDTKHNFRFALMSREDFLYRIKCNDRFVKEVVTDPDNLIGVNQLQGALG